MLAARPGIGEVTGIDPSPARRRVAAHFFFGYIAYASLTARKHD